MQKFGGNYISETYAVSLHLRCTNVLEVTALEPDASNYTC